MTEFTGLKESELEPASALTGDEHLLSLTGNPRRMRRVPISTVQQSILGALPHTVQNDHEQRITTLEASVVPSSGELVLSGSNTSPVIVQDGTLSFLGVRIPLQQLPSYNERPAPPYPQGVDYEYRPRLFIDCIASHTFSGSGIEVTITNYYAITIIDKNVTMTFQASDFGDLRRNADEPEMHLEGASAAHLVAVIWIPQEGSLEGGAEQVDTIYSMRVRGSAEWVQIDAPGGMT